MCFSVSQPHSQGVSQTNLAVNHAGQWTAGVFFLTPLDSFPGLCSCNLTKTHMQKAIASHINCPLPAVEYSLETLYS